MLATREWFAENSRKCIADAVSGNTKVNDLDAYITFHEHAAFDSLAGKYDGNLTFQQRRHFIQTGECIPILPPVQPGAKSA